MKYSKLYMWVIAMGTLLFTACSTAPEYSDYFTAFYGFEAVEGSTMDDNGKIAVVGAFPNEFTHIFIQKMEDRLGENTSLTLILQEEITESFPSYPCNVISMRDEIRNTYEKGMSAFDEESLMKVQMIGETIGADYLLFCYVIEGESDEKTSIYGTSARTESGYSLQSKGILWDVEARTALGQYNYYPNAVSVSRSLSGDDDIFSKEIRNTITENSAEHLSQVLIDTYFE